MKRFLDNVGLKALIETIQKKYAENLQSSSTDANAGKFTYTVYKDKTGGGIEAETKTIDTGANKVTIAEGSTSGAISVTTNGETASVGVHNVLTTDTAQNISATKTVTTGNKLILVDAPSNDTDAANKSYVDSKILESEAMQYRGSINQSSDLPTVSNTTNNVKVGATYKVATAGTYSYYNGTSTIQQACKIGDLFIAQSIPSTGTKTITWDFIPSANETETSVALTNSTPSISTTPQTGPVTFGQAAAKQVDTSISANSASTNLPTSAAVATYAISGVTAGSGIEVGEKTNGTQDIKIQLSYMGSEVDDPSFGLKFNTATGDITPGLAIDNGSSITFDNNGKLIVKIRPTYSGLTVDSSGVSVNLLEEEVTSEYGASSRINTSGLTITNNGELKINAGRGLVNYLPSGSEPTPGLFINNGNGLSFDITGKLIVQAKPTNSGLAVDGSGVRVVTGSGIIANNSGVKVNAGDGLTFDNNQLVVDLDDNGGLIFNDTTGKLKINTHYNGLVLDNNDGSLKIDTGYGLEIANTPAGSGTLNVKLDTNNTNGLSVGANGLALAAATQSTAGAMSATDKTNLDNVKSTYAHSLTATTNSTAGVDLKLNDNSTTPVALSTVNVKGGNGASVDISSGSVAVVAVANSVKGIAVGGSGIGINLKATDSGLAFNTGTGGDNGLYVDALTTQEIEAMWTSSTPPTSPTPEAINIEIDPEGDAITEDITYTITTKDDDTGTVTPATYTVDMQDTTPQTVEIPEGAVTISGNTISINYDVFKAYYTDDGSTKTYTYNEYNLYVYAYSTLNPEVETSEYLGYLDLPEEQI